MKQLPLVPFGDMGRTIEILFPLDHWPFHQVRAGCIPVAGMVFVDQASFKNLKVALPVVLKGAFLGDISNLVFSEFQYFLKIKASFLFCWVFFCCCWVFSKRVLFPLSLFLMLWQSGDPLMKHWNHCLPSFWDIERTRDFAPTTTTNHYLSLGQNRLCSTSWNYRRRHSSHWEYSSSGFKLTAYPILSTHGCRWCLGSVPVGFHTLYPWTDRVQLRSQDPFLPAAGLNLRLWWLTGSGEPLQPLLPWAIFLQFHSFTSPLVSRLCSRS